MGKIRVKVLGDESAEKEQQEQAKKRKEAKIAEAKAAKADTSDGTVTTQEPTVEEKPQKKAKSKYQKKVVTVSRSKKYTEVKSLIEKNKTYKLKDALDLLPKLKLAKFDETVELHINTLETGVSGSMTLPHGTGKKTRVVIATEEVIANIEKGIIDFDLLVAEPQMMPKLAKVAKVLGPRGLMPNPKNGTVTPKPEEVAKKYEGGLINFKTEAKFPLLHVSVGKVSFGEEKLADNIKTALKAVQIKNIKSATLKSTMSPGIKLDTASL